MPPHKNQCLTSFSISCCQMLLCLTVAVLAFSGVTLAQDDEGQTGKFKQNIFWLKIIVLFIAAPWDFPFIRVAYSADGFDRQRRFDSQDGVGGALGKLLDIKNLDTNERFEDAQDKLESYRKLLVKILKYKL